MLALFLAATVMNPDAAGAALIAAHRVPIPTGMQFDCGVVTQVEVSGFGENSAMLEFVLDNRAYYIAGLTNLPEVFSGLTTVVTASRTSRTPVMVAYERDSNNTPIVHFIDLPAPLADEKCRRVPPPPPPK